MKFEEIKQLIELLDNTELMEFKMKEGDFELSIRTKEYHKLRRQQVVQAPQSFVQVPPAVTPAPQSNAPADFASPPSPPPPSSSQDAAASSDAETEGSTENLLAIKSPIVGTFYRASGPEKPPYVKVGDVIEKGAVVCIVEAMKLFNEIESEVAGKIVKVEVEDASPVEYDQVLFWVEPA